MLQTLAPSVNGVLKLTKRSIAEFQFGDGEPVVQLDVIAVTDQWHEVNFALRVLENDMWVLPADKVNEFGVNRLNFVQAIVNDAYSVQHPDAPKPVLSRIEAEEFIALVQKEAASLRNFSYLSAAETSSVPESTEEARGINFSQ